MGETVSPTVSPCAYATSVECGGGIDRPLGGRPGLQCAKFVEHVGPFLHEPDTLAPIARAIVGPPYRIVLLMTERRFDNVGIEAVLIEDRACRRAETAHA